MKPLTLIASTDTKVLINTFVQWFCLCIFGLIVGTYRCEEVITEGSEIAVLSKCANPACFNTFRYFREGKLYVIDAKAQSSKSRALEYFWLCSSCCQDMTIEIDDDHAVTVFRKQAIQSALVQPAE